MASLARRIRDHDLDVLLSIHIPKTAGSTFRRVLEASFRGGIRYDYADAYSLVDPVDPGPLLRIRRRLKHVRYMRLRLGRVLCIHGHFRVSKYLEQYARPYVATWVRDPVERVASHYHHWLRNPDWTHSVCRTLHEEKLSLEEFAAVPSMRNLQSRYLDGLDPALIDFLGVTEQFRQLIPGFRAELGLDGEVTPKNVNPEKPLGGRYTLENDLRGRIADLNPGDMYLYDYALSRAEGST